LIASPEYLLMSADESLDADLLSAVPDPDAVRALYARHVDAVFHFAVRRCRNPEDVADLVSIVFLQVFSAAASYDRRRGEVRVWLLGIAARLAPSAERALAELTEAEQSLFLLVAHDGLPVADAARSLGLTPVVGRMRLARARRKLRAAIELGGNPARRRAEERRPGVAAAKEKP
jgi:DNA-directed RNA polymerase specialized sigma24 family protein